MATFTEQEVFVMKEGWRLRRGVGEDRPAGGRASARLGRGGGAGLRCSRDPSWAGRRL